MADRDSKGHIATSKWIARGGQRYGGNKRNRTMGRGSGSKSVSFTEEDKPSITSVTIGSEQARSIMKLVSAGYTKKEAEQMWSASITIEDDNEEKEEKDDDELSAQLSNTSIGDASRDIEKIDDDQPTSSSLLSRPPILPPEVIQLELGLEGCVDRTVLNGFCYCLCFKTNQEAVDNAMNMAQCIQEGKADICLMGVVDCNFLMKIAKSGLGKYIKVKRGNGAYLFTTAAETTRLSLSDAMDLNIRDVSEIMGNKMDVLPSNAGITDQAELDRTNKAISDRKRQHAITLGIAGPDAGVDVSDGKPELVKGITSSNPFTPSRGRLASNRERESEGSFSTGGSSFKASRGKRRRQI